jgi:4'-phosphopantetheinyl transferase
MPWPLTVPIVLSGTQNLDCQLLTADLTLSSESHEFCYCLLSPEERDRAMRFIHPVHQRHFVAARGLLRTVLGESVGASPKTLQFAYGPYGKPRLVGFPRVQFNLSHCYGKALIGISQDRSIGVDLEQLREIPDWKTVAKQFFSGSEYESIRQGVEADSIKLFLKYWTCKEAYLKGTGDGIGDLQQLEVSITSDGVRVVRTPCRRNFSIVSIELAEEFIAAIALEI